MPQRHGRTGRLTAGGFLAVAACCISAVATVVCLVAAAARAGEAGDLIPPASAMQPGRPRLLLRPRATPLAVSLEELRGQARDADFRAMLDQLRRQKAAHAQAMVYLLTGDEAAVDKAVRRMLDYRCPDRPDTFHIFYRLLEFGLAYDWLYDAPGVTPEVRAEIRARVAPLAERGLRASDDHVFHNYIWMSAGGVAVWAMAIAGEDEDADRLFETIRTRFNRRLYPAWRYLDGLPSEPMGYWALYVLAPGVWTLLSAQSAFETDLVGRIRTEQDGWLDRHVDNLVQSTLPNLRYLPWGDLQGGPNGGVTHEMACVIDAATWALRSGEGAWLSRKVAAKRGLRRFYGDTAVFYMLYTPRLGAEPTEPPRSFFAGADHAGHVIARSGWGDGDTVVAFTCTDHYGDHHHYDQGSFIIYRGGLLAVDPPVYRKIRGPQQRTENHSTLLIDGKPQRPCRGQWFKTVEAFKENLDGGRRLECGDILFHRDAGPWAAVAGRFDQAYECQALASLVRQILFVRPGTVVVVDRLTAAERQRVPPVQWLLQVPAEPETDGPAVTATNGTSWIRCRPVHPSAAAPHVEVTPVGTHRVAYAYPAGDATGAAEGPGEAAADRPGDEADAQTRTLVHVLEVGDGEPVAPVDASVAETDRGVSVTVGGRTFTFSGPPDYAVAP